MVRVLDLALVGAAPDAIAPLHMFGDDALQAIRQARDRSRRPQMVPHGCPPDNAAATLPDGLCGQQGMFKGVDFSFWQLSGNLMIGQSITARDPKATFDQPPIRIDRGHPGFLLRNN
jgi:hypothetical protein